MATPRAGWLGALVVIVGATLFGSLGVAARIAYEAGVEPLAFVAWRGAFGAIGLIAVVLAFGGPRAAWASLMGASRPAKVALGLGVIAGAGVNLSIFFAFDLTTVALALLGFYTFPAMVAAASALLGHEPLGPTRLVALGLALAGMVAVVLGGVGATDPAKAGWVGILLGLAAAAFQTLFVLSSRGYTAIRADAAIATILAGSAALGAAVTVAVAGPSALLLPLHEPRVLVLLAGVGLLAAALPSVLFLTGIRWIGGVRTGILMLIEPVVGVALAAALLNEGLQPLQIVGGTTILVAALIVQGAPRPPAEAGIVVPAPGGP